MSPHTVIGECGHDDAPHQHGTRDAYVLDGCRCSDCRRANAAAEQHRRREITYGRWQPFVQAEPARQHLRALSERGIGLRRAAQLSDVPYTTLVSLVYGAPRSGIPPSSRIREDTAHRVLAISVVTATPAGGSRIDAVGTLRRLQALIAIGWSISALADHLGRDAANLRHTMRSDSVNTATATAVTEIFQQLWDRPPDETTPSQRAAATNARAMARSNGWRTAMAWDDIDTDPDPDPSLPPIGGKHDAPDDEMDIDILTERITTGQSVPLTPGRARDEVIQRLTRRGFSLPEIADLLDLTTRTVSRRRRAGRAA